MLQVEPPPPIVPIEEEVVVEPDLPSPTRTHSTTDAPIVLKLDVLREDADFTEFRDMWHTISTDEVAKRVVSNKESGLTSVESARRLKLFGHNVLSGSSGRGNVIILLLKNFFGFLSILLIVATVTSFATSQWVEGAVLAFIVIFNALLGFFQEYSSERTLEALRKMTAAKCKVIRSGRTKVRIRYQPACL